MSRAEARAELDKILAPINGTAVVSAGHGCTLRRYVETEYLVAKAQVWKASTRTTTEQIIETHILSEIGDRLITSFRRRELQALLDAKAAAGLSSSVVGHVRWQLVAIFDMAQSDGLISFNPTTALATPRCVRPMDKRIITVDDIRRAQMVLDIRDRLVFCLAVREGMRPGEIVGVKLSDFRDGIVHIARRIYRGKEAAPKTGSTREVGLTATTQAVMEQYIELLNDRSPDAWLFPSETGKTPLSYSNIYRRRIRPALAKVGLGNVNFQVLRRTWVTEFSESGTDPAIRAKVAGHSVDVHENEYRQVKADVLKRAAEEMEKRLQ
jgi:integrase